MAFFLNSLKYFKVAPALWLLACSQPASSPTPPPKLPAHWLAQVDGTVLVRADVEREASVGIGGVETADKPTLSLEASLAELIDKTLLLNEAHKRQLFPTEAQLKQHVQVLMSGFLHSMAENPEEAQGFSLAHFEKMTAEHMAIEALLYEEVFGRIAVTEEALRSFYKNNAELFFSSAEIEASQIVVKTKQEADKLLRLLRAGQPFDKLARQHSIAPEAENGGSLGRIEQGVMPSPMDEALFAMRANEISNPVPSPFGWHLFWVQRKFRPRTAPFLRVRNAIEARLVAERGTEMKAEFLQKLRNQAHIQINEALVNPAPGGNKRASEETP